MLTSRFFSSRMLQSQHPSAFAAAPALVAAVRSVYSDIVQDHFDRPRNVGKFKKSDPNVGGATVGAPECGDMARVQIKVNDETGMIEDTRIQVYGCGSAIASTSYVSEKLKGKTLSEALEITNKDIAAELSLPPVKLHCSLLAEEAVHAAVADYLQKKPQLKSKKMRSSVGEATPELKTAHAAH